MFKGPSLPDRGPGAVTAGTRKRAPGARPPAGERSYPPATELILVLASPSFLLPLAAAVTGGPIAIFLQVRSP